MSRVRDVAPDELPPSLAEIYSRFAGDYGPFLSQVAVLAHVLPALRHVLPMLMELKAEKKTPWRYIELAIVTVSKVNACEYCVAHHTPMLALEGVSAALAERVLDYATEPGFTPVDRLVIEYAIQLTRDSKRVKGALFDALRRHFTEAQLVELTFRICLCTFFNKFNEALAIDDESAGLPDGALRQLA
jgi:AhpD family alkylhydroperoxidase